MARALTKPDWQRAVIALSAAVVTALIVLMFYHAQIIFIPLALAIFLTFVLSPPVVFLQKRGLGRGPAVGLVVGTTFLAAATTALIIAQQTAGLLDTMAQKENADRLTAKVERVRHWVSGGEKSELGQLISNLQEAVSSSTTVVEETGLGALAGSTAGAVLDQAAVNPAGALVSPGPVVRTSEGPGWLTKVKDYVSPLGELAGQFAFAFILVVFMLLKKEDLRNRFLRLVGEGRVTTTTKAVDDASRRVSRYLLIQLILNTVFALVICLGLYLIGVRYAILWAFIAFLMRYVPYVGTWIGLIPPVVFAFAMTEQLWQPVAVVALFMALEVICNNVFEPWLYGTSLGMSEVAQLIAAGFWSMLWGPVGLILSGPLTTCLLVLGKHVPALKFLDVLLGKEPPLTPGVTLYQRLTARDQDEASRIVHSQSEEKDLVGVFDAVVVEALTLTKTAAELGELDADDEKYILGTMLEIVEDVSDDVLRPHVGTTTSADAEKTRILVCPAEDEADRVVLEMLTNLLGSEWEVDVTATATLTSELIDRVEQFKPTVVCISSLPPGALAHTRYLCKRLKQRFPELKVVVGRWGQQGGVEDAKQALSAAGADEVYLSLAEARQEMNGWLPVLQSRQSEDGTDSPADGKTTGPQELVGTGRA